MTKEQKKPFTKREWITLIVLLSIVQAFFWYAVFENSQSSSALSYVSFAGTLVSIILAVLAIGYTYGESISQKGKSDELAEQIKTLGGLIESVEIEAKSLEKIQVISKELTSFIGTYKSDKQVSEKHLADIQSSMLAFSKVEHKPIMNSITPLSELEQLFNDRSPLDTLCYLMLVYLEENQSSHSYRSMEEINELLHETPMNLDIAFFRGAMFTQSSLLQNLGYIEVDNGNYFKLNKEFKEYIKTSLINKEELEGDSSYTKIIKNVYKIVLG
ncbi:hypothetical protein EXT43_12640 [Pseudoalteromonas sp. CO109Y]|uniref:hypothetical protein n=1 Tax=Pseudoalteromonas sp. CO109Y TaxID=1777235 RepID=UPI0010230E32|nr:hypothetical protein [Pseudoalteromonas sp. CO109Y]RZF81279.1 hypothetical protein EXT43_12640 [Pseudoalteromonas sp. CO109Y]